MGILRDRACFRRHWTSAIIRLRGGSLISCLHSWYRLHFFSAHHLRWPLAASEPRMQVFQDEAFSLFQCLFQYPPHQKTQNDDMYPHMLIKGKREQCGIIWLVSLGHGPPTKKVNAASTVQCFSTNVTLFSSLREHEPKSLHVFDVHNWEEGCLAPSG